MFRKKDKEVETCIVDESMWNVFTRVPRRAIDLRQGWQHSWWSKDDVALVELVWVALDEYWEETYFQYAWFFRDGGAEVNDSLKRLIIEDKFVYNGVKCRRIVVPSQRCGKFGCRALVMEPDEAVRRLWHLYERYKAKRAK